MKNGRIAYALAQRVPQLEAAQAPLVAASVLLRGVATPAVIAPRNSKMREAHGENGALLIS
jgi:hypothetical protein